VEANVDMNEAVLFNMRNAYQNYNVAVNLSNRMIYTYLGVLKPNLGNAKWKLHPAYLDDVLELRENELCGLRAKESEFLARRTYVCLEHEIEFRNI
jgi:predicted glycoside hydrolase/deacetylase ChbG (UPF0249 family)